ncbi:hypothetical protein AGMMS49940_24530 [Spirochaetia bacterium]|nr:hypothetical protein AGMMS49940_24530 [Spirochaetia bacterium]
MDVVLGFILLFIIVLAVGIWIYLKQKIYVESQLKYQESLKDQERIIQELKNNYDNALKSADKETAISAGRLYYKSLRHGLLTNQDETAITNDVSTMKL